MLNIQSGRFTALFACFFGFALALQALFAAESTALKIVMDDNYPPFVFRDAEGRIKGILPDQWRLWSSKTGRPIILSAMDWGQAQAKMAAGDFDVIDTIFKSPSRNVIYDFSEPYQDIEVPVFCNNDIAGITNLSDLKGFVIGVKAGDNVIEVLQQAGVNDLTEFDSYEAIIQAARDGKIKVFTMDKPPALYFMYKMQIHQRFNQVMVLYTGQFHRAVKKGNIALLNEIKQGFTLISKTEYQKIESDWYGRPIVIPDLMFHVLIGIGITIGLGIIALIWALWLRALVAQRTKALEASNRYVHAVIDALSDAVFIHNEVGEIIEVNARFSELYGFSKAEGLSISLNTVSYGTPPYSAVEALEHLAKTRQTGQQIFEWRARNKNGLVFPVEVNLTYAIIDGKERYIACVRDITDRKKQEERTQIDLHDKEILLTELYHRTKNNMQAIIALIVLQRLEIQNPDTITMLLDLESRIQSMALVHQMLYQSHNLSSVRLDIYVPELSKLIYQSYKIDAERIECILEIGKLTVGIDTAISLGLIINELLVNALKHAFPKGQKGRVAIRLAPGIDESIYLEVSDNGVGVPANFRLEDAKSIGLKTILAISRDQLKGEITLDLAQGFSCGLHFRELHKTAP